MKAFTQPLHDLSEYEQIVSDLAGHRTPIHIDGCIDSQKCHLISSIGEPYPVKLIVTYNEIKAKEIYADYQFFDRNVFYYPAKDIIFYNADIHGNLIGQPENGCYQANAGRRTGDSDHYHRWTF